MVLHRRRRSAHLGVRYFRREQNIPVLTASRGDFRFSAVRQCVTAHGEAEMSSGVGGYRPARNQASSSTSATACSPLPGASVDPAGILKCVASDPDAGRMSVARRRRSPWGRAYQRKRLHLAMSPSLEPTPEQIEALVPHGRPTSLSMMINLLQFRADGGQAELLPLHARGHATLAAGRRRRPFRG